ncbi:MAG: hypothetical protein H6725_08690 [Sandaracinaceae bacterium]|nr:hypothetical protein [Sandaracinaceae bacterium]
MASPPAPAVSPPATRASADDDDEPTSFMDRDGLQAALNDVAADAPAPAAAPAPLADTLPEFVVSTGAVAPPVSLPKKASLPSLAGLAPRSKGEVRPSARPAPLPVSASPSGVPAAEPEPALQATAQEGGETVTPRASKGGRKGLWLFVAIVAALGAGVGAHVAGVLPPAWSAAIDDRVALLRGGHEEAPTPPPPATPDPEPEPTAAPAPPDTALAELEGALARGEVPSELTTFEADGAEPADELLRLRAEAALLRAAPWWSATPDGALLSTALGALGARAEAGGELSTALRATQLRLRVATGDASALAETRALASAHADDALVRWALAEALTAGGELEEADAALAQLLESAPATMHARVALQRAWIARQRGQRDTERASVERALALAPEWELVRLRLIDLRLDTGEFRAVLDELAPDEGAATDAESDERVLRRLRASLGVEDFELAEALWAQLPEPVRARPDVMPTAAQFYMMRGEPNEAVGVLAEAAQAETATAGLITLYADALYDAGRTLDASAQYERAIALDGSHPEALIGFAQVLLRARKYREARVNLDRAEAGLRGRARPPATLARLRVMRARIMVEERELAQAAVLLRRTLEIPGAPSEGWFYLGEALSRSNSPEARAAYERYLALHPVGPLAARARRAIQ